MSVVVNPIARLLLMGEGTKVSPYNSEYNAIINYANSQGYVLPSEDQMMKQNSLIDALKANGVWNKLDILYVFATDGDNNFATINWKNPNAFKCSMVGTPSHITNIGFWNNNVTTNYLNTGWTPSINGVQYTTANSSVFIEVNNNINGSSVNTPDYGSSNTATLRLMYNSRFGTERRRFLNSNAVDNSSPGISSKGFHLQQRVSSLAADHSLYVDGVLISSTGVVGSGTAITWPVYIMSQNNFGTPSTAPVGREYGCFGIGSSLSGLEMALYTAWNAYKTSL